jgi:hypothetical protein
MPGDATNDSCVFHNFCICKAFDRSARSRRTWRLNRFYGGRVIWKRRLIWHGEPVLLKRGARSIQRCHDSRYAFGRWISELAALDQTSTSPAIGRVQEYTIAYQDPLPAGRLAVSSHARHSVQNA